MSVIKLFLIAVLLILLQDADGQKIYSNWYFGINAGLTFTSVPPSAVNGSQINTLEGCATVSDSTGKLLFYTDGLTVWDKNNNVMPNGTGLDGGWSASQSALIVPVPGTGTRFYIFTVTDWLNNGDLRYSIVDMKLNSGNGDIIPAAKNIFLSTKQTEKLVSANASNCGVWVITHERDNNRFEARLVTSNGIENPVFSDVGSIHTSALLPPDNSNNLTGVMKVSKDNTKIGLATLGRIIELFDFNASTGTISNPISLPMNKPLEGYGVCFSPDNSKFYITAGNPNSAGYQIYQYDLSSGNAATIVNSRILVGKVKLPVVIVGDLQIGADNKIYYACEGTNFIGVIPNPNLTAPLCGFNNKGVSLGNGISQSGLPNDIRSGSSMLQLDLGSDTTLCPGETLLLNAPEASSYLWSNGASTQSISISTAGKYWLQISNGMCTASDTIDVSFAAPMINLGHDTTLCEGQSFTLDAGAANSYLWSTGSTTRTINIDSAGEYWVEVSNGTCASSDSINVLFATRPIINLGNDTTLCQGQSLPLNAGTANKYLWSTGAATQSINVGTTGRYWVRAANGTCTAADTINVLFEVAPVVNLGADTALCQGQLLTLNAGTAGSYLWSTGARTSSITVAAAGNYWVEAITGGCFSFDTIDVSFASSPAVNLGNDTVLCKGQSLTLKTGAAHSYLWSTGETTQSINVTTTDTYWARISNGNCIGTDTINVAFLPSHQINLGDDTTMCQGQSLTLNAGSGSHYLWSTGTAASSIVIDNPGQYWVEVSNGSCFSRDTINVTYQWAPVKTLPGDTIVCDGQPVILKAADGYRYAWSTGDTLAVIKVSRPGIYSVVVSYGTNCQVKYAADVKFEECDCQIQLPTAFTPNNDGKNDIFKPLRASGCQLIEFSVYNRWGQRVFETTNPENGWNGDYLGYPQNAGVYVWLVRTVKNGEARIMKGTVTLIR